MAPASTGSESRIIHAVAKIAQGNSGTFISRMPGARMFRKVVIMLIAPRIDEAPDRCSAKMPKSVAMPSSEVESGGYSTQPTPEPAWALPPGARIEQIASVEPATYSQ